MHIASINETIDEIDKSINDNKFIQHSVVNVAKLVNMRTDQTLYESVSSCDIINIDGMGVLIGAKILGHKVPERVSGIDLFYKLLKLSEEKKYPVFFLGAKEDVLKRTIVETKRIYPKLKIGGSHHGYFWDDEESIVKLIQKSKSKLLFVAITSPKKENFINTWREKLGVNFVMGVGGAFDVVAGSVSRAPAWMQSSGLEWFYRLLQEPKRMWKRYLITNTKFAFLLLMEWLKLKMK